MDMSTRWRLQLMLSLLWWRPGWVCPTYYGGGGVVTWRFSIDWMTVSLSNSIFKLSECSSIFCVWTQPKLFLRKPAPDRHCQLCAGWSAHCFIWYFLIFTSLFLCTFWSDRNTNFPKKKKIIQFTKTPLRSLEVVFDWCKKKDQMWGWGERVCWFCCDIVDYELK